MINNIWSILFLTVCSAMDIKEQKISAMFCILNWWAAIVVHIVLRQTDMEQILFVASIGGGIFMFSIITREAIGKGDAFIITALGQITGPIWVVQIFIWALCFCAVFALIGIAIKKLQVKSRIPFAPFLLAGEIFVLLS